LFLSLFIFSACSFNLAKKDDPIEQTKNYVAGLKADEIRAEIVGLQSEYSQLEQMVGSFGPVGDAGENYLEKASSTKAKISELEEQLKKVENLKK